MNFTTETRRARRYTETGEGSGLNPIPSKSRLHDRTAKIAKGNAKGAKQYAYSLRSLRLLCALCGSVLYTSIVGSYLKGVDAGLVVVNDEEFGDQVVIFKFSRKRKAFTDIAGDACSQGGVPSFNVVGFTCFLAHLLMIALAEQDAVGLPVVAIRLTAQVLHGDLAQQSAKGDFTAISNHVGHDLSGALTKRCPEPLLVFLAATEAA